MRKRSEFETMDAIFRPVRFGPLVILLLLLLWTWVPGFSSEEKAEMIYSFRAADSLNELAMKFRTDNIGLAKSYANQALRISQSGNYMQGEALAYYILATATVNEELFPVALNYAFKSLDIFKKLKDDQKQIMVNDLICFLFLQINDPQRAETYLNNVGSMIDKMNNPLEHSRYFIGKGSIAMQKGKYTEAISDYYRSIYFSFIIRDSAGMGIAYKSIGDVYVRSKQLYKAIFYYGKSIDMFMSGNDLSQISILNTRIAHAYQALGIKKMALEYNIKAYYQRKSCGIRRLIVSSIINVGGAYMELGKFDSAEIYLQKGLSESIDENYQNLIEEGYQLMADCYSLQKKYLLSLENYRKYMKYHLRSLENRNKTAIHSLETEHLITEIESTHNLLTRQKEAQDAQIKAHRFQFMFIGIILFLALALWITVKKLSVRTQRTKEELSSLNIKLEKEIREHIEAVRQLKASENLYRFLAQNYTDVITLFDRNFKRKFVSPSCRAMYGFTEEELITRPDSFEVVDLSYRKQVRTSFETILNRKVPQTLVYKARRKDGSSFWVENQVNPMFDPITGEVDELVTVVRDISDRMAYEEKLGQNERQKGLLLHEIHHRVKNNFAILISLMDLQRQFKIQEPLEVHLTDLQLRVRTMSLVHEQLYQNQSIDSIPLGPYLDRLTSIISSAFSKPNIIIHANVQECAARIEIALPLGLIVNELLTNSFKYAFPENSKGNIWIELQMDSITPEKEKGLESIYYILTVSDDGVGFPQDFSLENTSSTGMQIVKILIEQLEARYETRPGKGSFFKIRFAAFPKEF